MGIRPTRTGGDDSTSRQRTTWMLAVATLFALVCSVGIILLQRSRTPTDATDDEPRGGLNVLFIVIDSLRHDHVGAYGYDRDATPEIDRLAREGIVFEDLIVQCSWTLPSHATMFTGLNAGAHGIDHNFERVDEEATTLPWILQQHGYKTVGIVAAPLLETPYGFQRGFDVYDDTLSTARGKKKPSWRTVTSENSVDMAMEHMESMKEDKFFMFLHMWDVHYDYIPPAPWDSAFDPGYEGDFDPFHWVRNEDVKEYISDEDRDYVVSLYDGEIAHSDDHLGRLFDWMRRTGLWDDTVVIVTSDHGEEFFDHGGTCHSLTLFDELVHVPFIMRVPGIEEPARIGCRSAMVDLMPTVLELTQVPAPVDVPLQGESLMGLVRGDRTCDPQRPILTETVWSLHDVPADAKKGYEVALYRGRYKISRRLEDPKLDYLFDLQEDPLEQHNLAEERPELFEELDGLLSEQLKKDQALHDQVRCSRHKKMDRRTVDTLKALGYMD